MGLFDRLFRWKKRKQLFRRLTLEEKRKVLDLSEFYFQSVLDARSGRARVHEIDTETEFVQEMTDDDIEEAMELAGLQQKARAATEAGNHREAIRIYEQICAKAPFDSISMMSIGVHYAYLGDGPKAVQYLEKALQSDPNNQRIRRNLNSIRRDLGL